MLNVSSIEFFPNGVYCGSHTLGEVVHRGEKTFIVSGIRVNDGVQIFVKEITNVDTSAIELMKDIAKMPITEVLYRTYREMSHVVEYEL
jgi:hypothetical protein